MGRGSIGAAVLCLLAAPDTCVTSAIYDAPSGYGFDTVTQALRSFGLDREHLRLRELRPGFFAAEQRESGALIAAYTVVLAEFDRWIVNGSWVPGECVGPQDQQ